MLEELSKQAGNTHVSRATGKTISKDVGTMYDRINENVSYNYSTSEERLFTVDELMSFTNGESMVLSTVHRADNSGEAVRPNPIYNTKETLLPMAYALHKDGHANDKVFATALQNAEVATSATDRDIYQTIPNFNEMYEKRFAQALIAEDAKEAYMKSQGFTEQDLLRRDVDVVSEGIMRIINARYYADLESQKLADAQNNTSYNGSQETNVENMTENMTDNERESIEGMSVQNIVNMADKLFEEAKVDSKNNMFTNEIVNAERKQHVISEAEKEPIYLNNTLSYLDIKQGSYIQSAMEAALNKINPSDMMIDTKNYKMVLDGFTKVIYDSSGRTQYMELSMDDKQVVEWSVSDAWIERLRNTAKPKSSDINIIKTDVVNADIYKAFANDVDELFDIDIDGRIRLAFMDAFKELMEV